MTEPSTSAVEQAIAARIAKVRAEGERRRQQRAELAAARAAGLGQRHAAKLRRQAAAATPAGASSFHPNGRNPMPDSRTPAGTELWRTAHTLEDLGELTAQWLEGRITHLPGYYADGPDEETTSLVPHLAEANRNGYVTDFSQPGLTYPGGDAQRAAVSGFCTEDVADRIGAAVLLTDLVAIVTPPGSSNPTQIPVTTDDGEAFTWVGGGMDDGSIDDMYGDDCPDAVEALKAAWQVDIFDPVWGRQDLLWERLSAVWAQ
ncbi:DUF6919 domain-containing protein [Streptomyces sediminimaris]|uniref:DUF6919 domain-containing protein n=1 Tax=Streptomyces sediminimaris TaxID=3383721 RepID=UPI00399AB1E7